MCQPVTRPKMKRYNVKPAIAHVFLWVEGKLTMYVVRAIRKCAGEAVIF